MKILQTILLLIFLTTSQFGLASEAGGPPKADDLIGFWKIKQWPNPAANKVNPWPLPYQWFAFYQDGRFMSMMNAEDANYTKEELSKIFSTLPLSPLKYQYHGQFVVIEDPAVNSPKEVWGVNLFAKDIGGSIKKGDLVMTLVGGKSGEAIYYRLLGKLE